MRMMRPTRKDSEPVMGTRSRVCRKPLNDDASSASVSGFRAGVKMALSNASLCILATEFGITTVGLASAALILSKSYVLPGGM